MNQASPAPAEQTDVDMFLCELDRVNKKLDYTIKFLEVVEALTKDQATADRIRNFLQEEGVWPSQQNS